MKKRLFQALESQSEQELGRYLKNNSPDARLLLFYRLEEQPLYDTGRAHSLMISFFYYYV
jgi:hypothetical protein